MKSLRNIADSVLGDLYASSHGITSADLGEVQILHDLLKDKEAPNCLVIGSGQGCIPKILTQLSPNGTVTLVDADYEAFPFNGRPNYFKGESPSIPGYPEIRVIKAYGIDAVLLFPPDHFDLVYEDSDHQIGTCLLHLNHYLVKMKRDSHFLVHDTNNKNENCTVRRLPDYMYLYPSLYWRHYAYLGEGLTVLSREETT